MRPGDREQGDLIAGRLVAFHQTQRDLPGIQRTRCREAFVEQVIESLRRVRYVGAVRARGVSDSRADPNDALFDPLKAAIVFDNRGLIDEAFWMIFFFVHFGKHRTGGWRYAREVYGRLGDGDLWDWEATSADPEGFKEWLGANELRIRRPGVPGGFGNHRKYQSLNAWTDKGTGTAVASYIQWIGPPRTHAEFFGQALQNAGNDPGEAFKRLYRSMGGVASFGRLARFDYLAMVGNLGLANIEPDATHLQGSTGPLKGARLLFGAGLATGQLETWLLELGAELGVNMQVLEDALCNWEKSPDVFLPFRG